MDEIADNAKSQLCSLPQKLTFPFLKQAGMTPEPDKPVPAGCDDVSSFQKPANSAEPPAVGCSQAFELFWKPLLSTGMASPP